MTLRAQMANAILQYLVNTNNDVAYPVFGAGGVQTESVGPDLMVVCTMLADGETPDNLEALLAEGTCPLNTPFSFEDALLIAATDAGVTVPTEKHTVAEAIAFVATLD